MKAEIFTVLLLFIVGAYSQTRQCFQCHDEDPMSSNCWNNTKEGQTGIEVVSCENHCFAETFQSGGEYWYVTKGCSDSMDNGCVGSNNCKGPHWGKCVKCCKDDLCNTEAPGTAMGISASIILSLAALVIARFL